MRRPFGCSSPVIHPRGVDARVSRAWAFVKAAGLGTLMVGCTSPPEDDGPAAGSGGLGGNTFAGAGGTLTSNGGSAPQGGSGGSNAGSGGSAAGQGGSGMAGGAGMGGAAGAGGVVATGALCPAGSLFCDSFEDDTVGQPPGQPWRESVNGATVNVDEVQAFSGSKAVHVNAPTGADYRRGYLALDQGSSANIFPAAAQNMYGRAMMYLQAIPGADSHWTFIQGEGQRTDANGTYNALYRYGGQLQSGAQLMANYETTDPVDTDCWDHSTTTMPAATWTCVEWHFAVASNEMQFWLNGTDLADIHVTGQASGTESGCPAMSDLGGQWLAPPAFQTLYLGWEHYQPPANSIDLWLDDVVVSTERVLCPAQ